MTTEKKITGRFIAGALEATKNASEKEELLSILKKEIGEGNFLEFADSDLMQGITKTTFINSSNGDERDAITTARRALSTITSRLLDTESYEPIQATLTVLLSAAANQETKVRLAAQETLGSVIDLFDQQKHPDLYQASFDIAKLGAQDRDRMVEASGKGNLGVMYERNPDMIYAIEPSLVARPLMAMLRGMAEQAHAAKSAPQPEG